MREMYNSQYHQGNFSAGPYHLKQLLGLGPFSRTYLVEHLDRPRQLFALKIMEAALLADKKEQEQILRELLVRKKMLHPRILAIEEEWISKGILYTITAYNDTGSLRQRLMAAPGNPLPTKEAIVILKGVGEALQFAHSQHITHADVKPENIFFQPDGSPLLADFLLPTLVRSDRSWKAYATLAASYMAPEQFQGTVATPLSDQYALACLACELLTGYLPFEADDFETLAQHHQNKPPFFKIGSWHEQVHHIEAIVLKALAKQPADRYPDIQTFIAALSAPPDLTPIPPIKPASSDKVVTLISCSSETQGLSELIRSEESPHQKTSTIQTMLEVSFPSFTKAEDESSPMVSSSLQQPAILSQQPPNRKPRWFFAIIIAIVLCVTSTGILMLHLSSANSYVTSGKISQKPSQSPGAPTIITSSTTVLGVPPSMTPSIQSNATQSSASPTAKTPPKQTPTVTFSNCVVSYTISSEWKTGFTASIKITNSSSIEINGWTLVFGLSGDQRIASSWSGNFTQTGLLVRVTNVSFNAIISPGDSIKLGFTADASSDTTPTTFTLNNNSCRIMTA